MPLGRFSHDTGLGRNRVQFANRAWTGRGLHLLCCLSFTTNYYPATVKQRVWDEVLVWMVDEQAMPKIATDERALIIDYLANWFGIDKPR